MTDSEKQPTDKAGIEALLGVEEKRGVAGVLRTRNIVWAGIAATALILAYIVFLTGAGTGRQTYITETVERGSITAKVTATGSVQPTNLVEISSELSGTVKKVHVDNNSIVEVGQELAELDKDKLVATVQSARAKLKAAQAKIREAEATADEMKKEFERKKNLADRQVASSHDLDTAKAAYDRSLAALESAKADMAVAKADLRLQETNLAKACICSPIKGVVLTRNVEPGQIVASSFQAPVLFSIAEDLKEIEIQVDVDEADVGLVKEGQTAVFTVDAYPDRKFTAKIRELHYGSEVIQGVVTYKAVLAARNEDLALRPGMTATAEIIVEEVKDGLLVPNTALRFSPPTQDNAGDGRSLLQRILPGPPRFRAPSRQEETGADRSVYVLRDGTPVRVKVRIGITDGRRTEIRGGELKAGDSVIVDTVTQSS